jgi:hypothetical protein
MNADELKVQDDCRAIQVYGMRVKGVRWTPLSRSIVIDKHFLQRNGGRYTLEH